LTGLHEAAALNALIQSANMRRQELLKPATAAAAVTALVAAIYFGARDMQIKIHAHALGVGRDKDFAFAIPLPERAPFREAKLRIDAAAAAAANPDPKLVRLIAEAMAVREMVLAAPSLSLTQIAQREGRCRTKLGKLLRLSWLSPRLMEAILDGAAPARLKRQQLLDADLPLCWRAQDRLIAASL
jgi:hypothetical protein